MHLPRQIASLIHCAEGNRRHEYMKNDVLIGVGREGILPEPDVPHAGSFLEAPGFPTRWTSPGMIPPLVGDGGFSAQKVAGHVH